MPASLIYEGVVGVGVGVMNCVAMGEYDVYFLLWYSVV